MLLCISISSSLNRFLFCSAGITGITDALCRGLQFKAVVVVISIGYITKGFDMLACQ